MFKNKKKIVKKKEKEIRKTIKINQRIQQMIKHIFIEKIKWNKMKWKVKKPKIKGNKYEIERMKGMKQKIYIYDW